MLCEDNTPDFDSSVDQAARALLRSLNIPDHSSCQITIIETQQDKRVELMMLSPSFEENEAPSDLGMQGAFILVSENSEELHE